MVLNPITIGSNRDFVMEFTLKLNSGTSKYVVASGDSYEIAIEPYINTRGIKITTPSKTITISACNPEEFYSLNTWRLVYSPENKIIYLYKNNKLQSDENFSGTIALNKTGQTNGESVSQCDNDKIWKSPKTEDTIGYNFVNSLTEANGGANLVKTDSKMLTLSSNKYTMQGTTLSKDKDWSLENYGNASKTLLFWVHKVLPM